MNQTNQQTEEGLCRECEHWHPVRKLKGVVVLKVHDYGTVRCTGSKTEPRHTRLSF